MTNILNESRNVLEGIRNIANTADCVENSVNYLQGQIGGNHYKQCNIQPVEFIEANSLGFLEGCVIKRLCRHNKETGKGVQDIEKAIHELQLLLDLRYRRNK